MSDFENLLLAFFSYDVAGLVIAGLVGLAGAALIFGLKRRWPGLVVSAAATALALGSIVHIVQADRIRDRYPAPGEYVEVDGTRLHILAEGPFGSGPTIVLFAGAHAGGLAIHNIHRRLRETHRSVLIDRPGTGWSGPADFPLTTAGEAEMMWKALEAAGERGPFLLAGHSFGGLLVANMARRRPDSVQALALLDPTPPDAIIYGPRLADLDTMRKDAFRNGFFKLFAVDYQALKGSPPLHPTYKRIEKIVADELRATRDAQEALARLPKAQMAAASIYRELSPVGMAEAGWDNYIFDGELGDMPVYLIAPRNSLGLEALPEMASAEQREALRIQNFFAAVRERAMAMSSNSQRIIAPEGTGHNFVFEAPEFTVRTLQRIARQ